MVQGKYLEGPNHMKIWPETLPLEVKMQFNKKERHFFILKSFRMNYDEKVI